MMRRSLSTRERAKEQRETVQEEGDNNLSISKAHPRRFRLVPRASRTRHVFIAGAILALGVVLKYKCDTPQTGPPVAKAIKLSQSLKQKRSSPLMVQLKSQDNETALRMVSHVSPPLPQKDWLGEEWTNQECVPMFKWQLPQYGPSTCNLLHESIRTSDMQFINCGGSRCAFQIQDSHNIPVVLKTPKYVRTVYRTFVTLVHLLSAFVS